MKTLQHQLLCAAVLLLTQIAIGQKDTSAPFNRYLFHTSIIHKGFSVGAEVQLKNRWLFYISRSNESCEAGNLPPSYRAGSHTDFWGIRFNFSAPNETLKTTTIGAGRVLTAPQRKSWVAAKAGVSAIRYQHYEFTKVPDGVYNFSGQSHSHDTITDNSIGLHLSVVAILPITSWLGIGAGMETILSGPKSRITYNLGLSFGYLKPKKLSSHFPLL